HRRGRGATPIYNNIMEPRWLKNVCMGVLWSGCLLCVIFVIVQNGTTAVLRCTFDSSEVVTKTTSVSWSFQSNQPDSQYFSIFYFSDGKAYPGQEEFKHRVQFVGDINKKDASIQLSPAQFSDNGTFFCDVKNPPDVSGTQGRTELRVVQKGKFKHVFIVILAVCGALILLIAVAIAALTLLCLIPTQLDALFYGPVIYVQLDHSGSKNSFHKMEPVVYADIRKN
uniref:Myelin protein zero-like 1 like n=1 Tax=Poecilia reticulata TaxID=8081 RepID=A0A3P9PHZ0_POERE